MKVISNLVAIMVITFICTMVFSLVMLPLMALDKDIVNSPLNCIAQCASHVVENMSISACHAAVALSDTSEFYVMSSVNQRAAAVMI